MRKKLTAAAISGAVAAFAFAPAGASAAHCVAPSDEPSAPGFSYFGTDHVKGTAHDSEGIDPGHMGTPGASNCITTAGNPGNGRK